MTDPYAMARLRIFIFLWVWLLVLVFGCGSIFADYSVDRYVGSLTNASPTSVTKRVSLYAAEVTEGEDTIGYQSAAYTISYSSGIERHIKWRLLHPTTLAQLEAPVLLGTSSSSFGGPWTIPSQTRDFDFKAELGYYQISTGNFLGTVGVRQDANEITVPGETTVARGALIWQQEFELAANSSTSLNLEHSGPFFVVIEELKHYITPDGGGSFAWEEEEEYTSTEHTEVSEETEHEPQSEIGGNVPDYDSGPAPEEETRHATVDTLQKADDNSESRHTETKGWLSKISAGVDAAVNAISGLGGGGPQEQEPDYEQAETDAESLREGVSGAVDAMDDVYQKLLDIAGAISMSLPSGSPQFYIEFDWQGETVVIQSTTAQDNFMAIVRAMLAALITFGALMALVGIMRNALAS
jgi:hypothetical protein